jgi:hypothetical protein
VRASPASSAPTSISKWSVVNGMKPAASTAHANGLCPLRGAWTLTGLGGACTNIDTARGSDDIRTSAQAARGGTFRGSDSYTPVGFARRRLVGRRPHLRAARQPARPSDAELHAELGSGAAVAPTSLSSSTQRHPRMRLVKVVRCLIDAVDGAELHGSVMSTRGQEQERPAGNLPRGLAVIPRRRWSRYALAHANEAAVPAVSPPRAAVWSA